MWSWLKSLWHRVNDNEQYDPLTHVTPFQEGLKSGGAGFLRCTNPYRKGVPGMMIEVDQLAEEWDDGHREGRRDYMDDWHIKARSAFREPMTD